MGMTFTIYHCLFSFVFGVAFGVVLTIVFFWHGDLSTSLIDRKEFKKLTGKALNTNLGSKRKRSKV
jgi:hypothetical protein